MNKPSFILPENSVILAEGRKIKRVQSGDFSGSFDTEKVQEMGNAADVANITTDRNYDFSVSTLHYGNIELMLWLARKEISADNTGVIGISDIRDSISDFLFYTSNKDRDLVSAYNIRDAKIDSVTMNFSVDGNATLDFAFTSQKYKGYTGSKAAIGSTRGEYATTITFTVDDLYGDAQTVSDEAVGTSDGDETDFQLDLYPIDSGSYSILIDSTLQVEDTDYTIDLSTGEIEFTTAPAIGEAITANYDFSGNTGEALYIDGALVDSGNWEMSGSTVTLSGDVEITEDSRIVYYYIPTTAVFPKLITDTSETPVVRRGQVEILFYKGSETDSDYVLRVQSVDVNMSFDRNGANQLGEKDAYDFPSAEKTVEISMELNASDLEILAKATDQKSEYDAETLTSIDFVDLLQNMTLEINLYNDEETHTAGTLLQNIKCENLNLIDPSFSIGIGDIGTESYSFNGSEIDIESTGNK